MRNGTKCCAIWAGSRSSGLAAFDSHRGICYTLAFVKRISLGLALFLFFSTPFLELVGQLPTSLDAESPTALASVESDFSAEASRGRRSLKRRQKENFSLKSLLTVKTPAREILPAASIKEVLLVPRSAKSSVYQQINVYRI